MSDAEIGLFEGHLDMDCIRDGKRTTAFGLKKWHSKSVGIDQTIRTRGANNQKHDKLLKKLSDRLKNT
jgi:hypothetical protein